MEDDPQAHSSERNIVGKRWEVLKLKLGEGNYGKVYQGKDLQTGAHIAVKVTNMKNLPPELQERLKGETDILAQVRHPNIVTLYDQLQNEKYQLLMLELMEGKDMHRLMVKGQPMHPQLVRRLFGDLSSGLLELHSRNIIHRDLKPQNLLLSSTDPEKAVLKIADFGFARYLGPREDMVKTVAGSPLYMAPEVLEAAVGNAPRGYNAKADLYSAGVILYQMVKGEPPYSAMTPHELLQKLRGNKRKPIPGDDGDLKELLDKLLQPEPSRRMGMGEFFTNPWVMGCLMTRPCRAAGYVAAAAGVSLAAVSVELDETTRRREAALWTAIQEKKSGAELVINVARRLTPIQPTAVASLHMKALQLVSSAWQYLHREQKNLMTLITPPDWDTAKTQLLALHRTCSTVLSDSFDSCPDDDADVEPADSILFDHARDLCLRATVEEVINNRQTAHAMYSLALDLMTHLSGQATSNGNSIQRQTATKCSEMITKRLRKTT